MYSHERFDFRAFGTILYPVALSLQLPIYIYLLVLEKSQKLKSMMQQHGMKSWHYVLTNYTFFLMLYSLVVGFFWISGIAVQIRFFVQVHFLLKFQKNKRSLVNAKKDGLRIDWMILILWFRLIHCCYFCSSLDGEIVLSQLPSSSVHFSTLQGKLFTQVHQFKQTKIFLVICFFSNLSLNQVKFVNLWWKRVLTLCGFSE